MNHLLRHSYVCCYTKIIFFKLFEVLGMRNLIFVEAGVVEARVVGDRVVGARFVEARVVGARVI